MKFSILRLGLLAGVVWWGPAAAAQTATGSISGVVEDESHAAVPGVSVAVTNVDTANTRTVPTDAGGRYHVPGLIPGPYEVQAQLQGFQTAIRKGIQLTVGSDLHIALILQVGTLSESTIVTAQAQALAWWTRTCLKKGSATAVCDNDLGPYQPRHA